jgi:hypothetical protein
MLVKRRPRGTCALVLLFVVAAAVAAPSAVAVTSHAFTATYSGKGTGAVSGTTASGGATAAGRGAPIGRGTMSGTAHGVFMSKTCVAFRGTAVLRGSAGSLRLSAQGAHACFKTSDPGTVLFTGSAKVAGGTATFAGARGTLTFSGTYGRLSGAVTISFKGRLTY